MLKIRTFKKGDELALRQLFFDTVRNVNIKDYSLDQVQAWASENYDEKRWAEKLAANNPFIAIFEGEIVGFADIQETGYIDHFFCHRNHQGKGVGKTLMQTLFITGQQAGITRLYSHVSITANTFFAHFGFKVLKEQKVDIRGQTLTNFIMEKHL